MKLNFTKSKLFSLLGLTLFSNFINAQGASICFSPKVNYAVGTQPYGIVTADFNNDGNMDIATANNNSNNTSVLLGSSTGTFAAAINYSVGVNPRTLTSGDFNNDGNADLVVGNYGAGSISVLLGTGTGLFGASTNFTIGLSASRIVAADFNKDGKTDLAITGAITNTLAILMGTGVGTFSAAVNYIVGSNPYGLTTSDFNGDGNLDLATANEGPDDVSILLGSNTGTFSAAVSYSVGASNPYMVISGDFNADGNIDLATADHATSQVSILIGSGTGTFANPVLYSAGVGTYGITTADFNGDTNLDLAAANFGTANVSTFRGNGNGTFASAVNFNANSGPYAILNADFNSDGKPDIAVANVNSNNVAIFLNGVPTISVTSGTICAGSTFSISANGATTYSYSGGSALVSPTVNTTYTVTGTSIVGCSVTAISNVSVNPLPTLNVTTTNSLLCTGETATISVTGASTYTWSDNSNGTDLIVTPTANTNFTVTGVDANNCSNSTIFTQSVSTCTGIEEQLVSNSLLIFPNPNNGAFTIQSQKTDVVNIINDLGQVIETIELTDRNNFSCNINDLQNGIYFLVGIAIKQKIMVSR